MILSIHAVFGAAMASLIPTHPVLGFTLGFASHLVLDAIPHRDYDLVSVEIKSKKVSRLIDSPYHKYQLIRDMIFVSLDAIVGLSLAFAFFFDPVYPWIFFIGALGSLLPDFFTFLYLISRHKILALFYHLHANIFHSQTIYKFSQPVGVFFQFCILVILIATLLGIKHLLFI